MLFARNISSLLRLSVATRFPAQRILAQSPMVVPSTRTTQKSTRPVLADTFAEKKAGRVPQRYVDSAPFPGATSRPASLTAPTSSNSVPAPRPLRTLREPFQIQLRKPLTNPVTFTNEAFLAVLGAWKNPAYLQPGQAPIPNPDRKTAGKALWAIMREFGDLDAGFRDYARVQTVDAQTQDVLVKAGLCKREEAATFLNANSNVGWCDLVSPAKRICTRLTELLGYQPNERQLERARHYLIGFFVRELFELKRDDNIGAVILKGFSRPVVLFWGSTMVGVEDHNSTFRNLIEKANVTNIANLYAASSPLHDLISKEVEVCEEYGGRVAHHDEREQVPLRQWRDEVTEGGSVDSRRKSEEIVSAVIKDIVLPGGEPPEGNLFVHCGGGMHRTGMIVGIMRRYFNGDSMEAIKADYQRHVAWKSEEDRGGYEDANIRFIEEFDLSVLERVLSGDTATISEGPAA